MRRERTKPNETTHHTEQAASARHSASEPHRVRHVTLMRGQNARWRMEPERQFGGSEALLLSSSQELSQAFEQLEGD